MHLRNGKLTMTAATKSTWAIFNYTNRKTRWSSIDAEKNVSLQRGSDVWKAFAAKLSVTYLNSEKIFTSRVGAH